MPTYSYINLLTNVAAANGAPTAVATVGTITTIASSSLVDGERFVIFDNKELQIFEFDSNGAATDTSRNPILINIASALTAAQVRDAIITAINGAGLDVVATNTGAAQVTVTHLRHGANGFAISETVANAGFIVAITVVGSLSGVPVAQDTDTIHAIRVSSTGATVPPAVTGRLWGYLMRDQTWGPMGTGTDANKGQINAGAALGASVGNNIAHHEVLPPGISIPDRIYLELLGANFGTGGLVSAFIQGRGSQRMA